VHHARVAERGGQFQGAVGEIPIRVLVRQVGPGPLVVLRGQLLQPQPDRGGREQELVRLIPELLRQPVRPQTDQPRHRLGDLLGGQRGQHPRVGRGPLGPGRMTYGGAAGDVRLVD
jgi:hypothetical protein